MIVLRKVYKKGKYLGMFAVDVDDLTPEFLEAIRKDKNDKMGWKKNEDVMGRYGYDIRRSDLESSGDGSSSPSPVFDVQDSDASPEHEKKGGLDP